MDAVNLFLTNVASEVASVYLCCKNKILSIEHDLAQIHNDMLLRDRYAGLETREVETDELEEKVIHFIVPVYGRQEALERFLNNYERVCLSPVEQRQRTELLVVLYAGKSEAGVEAASIPRLIDRLKRDYGEERIRLIEGRGTFSRARALDQGAALLRDDDLMFFVDVDIGFGGAALRRMRRNTLLNERIYFPVVFSQYDPRMVYGPMVSSRNHAAHPSNEISEISEITGFWRLFGFGIVAVYKSDYDAIGRFDLTIEGWGKEDVDLFEKAVRSELRVFRAPDRDLVHIYHGISCDKALKGHQFSMCKGTRADTYASTEQLASLVYRNPEYLWFARTKRVANANFSSPAA